MRTIRLTHATWHVAPCDQGQIVEIAYTIDDGVVVRRSTDQSVSPGHPERVGYQRADADSIQGEYEPWNEPPRVTGTWETCHVWDD